MNTFNWSGSLIDERWWNWKNTDFTMRDICEASEYDTRFPEKQHNFISDDPVDAFFAAFVSLTGYSQTKYNGEYIPCFEAGKEDAFGEPYQAYFDSLTNRTISIFNSDDLDEVLGNTKLRDFDLKEDVLSFLDHAMENEIYGWESFENYALLYLTIKSKGLKLIEDKDIVRLSKKYGWEKGDM